VKSANSSFRIKVDRIKSALDDSKEFYWFYVRLHLLERNGGELDLGDVELVEYHLLDKTFRKPHIRIKDPRNGFEYRFWLWGFIEVSADVITKSGSVYSLSPVKLEWDYTPDELERNGKAELSWD